MANLFLYPNLEGGTELNSKTIVIINPKGGVGKTTT